MIMLSFREMPLEVSSIGQIKIIIILNKTLRLLFHPLAIWASSLGANHPLDGCYDLKMS